MIQSVFQKIHFAVVNTQNTQNTQSRSKKKIWKPLTCGYAQI